MVQQTTWKSRQQVQQTTRNGKRHETADDMKQQTRYNRLHEKADDRYIRRHETANDMKQQTTWNSRRQGTTDYMKKQTTGTSDDKKQQMTWNSRRQGTTDDKVVQQATYYRQHNTTENILQITCNCDTQQTTCKRHLTRATQNRQKRRRYSTQQTTDM